MEVALWFAPGGGLLFSSLLSSVVVSSVLVAAEELRDPAAWARVLKG